MRQVLLPVAVRGLWQISEGAAMNTRFVHFATGAMLAVLLPLAAQAQPVITNNFVFTENRGATSVFAAGHSFIVGANAITPSGAGTSAIATHLPGGSGPDYALGFFPGPLFPDQYAARVPYAGQTGQWTISASNGAGTTTATTHVLDDVRALPLITGLTASGPALTPHLTWNPVNPELFPSFCGGTLYGACDLGYDFFQYQIEVRLVTGTPGNPAPLAYTSSSTLYTSTPGTLTPDLAMTQFDIPVGVLSLGNQYLIGVRLNHFELEGFPAPGRFFSPLENRSTSYIEVAAIPEPETYAMLLAGLALLGFAARRRKLKEAAAA